MLMESSELWKGWTSLCVGVTLLFPTAGFINRMYKICCENQKAMIVQSSGETVAPEMSLSTACLPPASYFTDGLCESQSKHNLGDVASYVVPETSGCYFVKTTKSEQQQEEEHQQQLDIDGENGSSSSISSISDDDRENWHRCPNDSS